MAKIQFYTDEHIDHAIALALRLHDIDVLTVVEAGKMSQPDTAQLEFATSLQRILVTRDEDYVILHHLNIPHAGIAYAHSRKSMSHVISGLILLHGVLDASEMENYLEYL